MHKGKRGKRNRVSGQKSIFTYLAPDSSIADQYRTIRTKIQGTKTGSEIRKILVTSPGSSEGKTTTSTNLAISFAQQGYRVLLVDANIRRPSIHDIFQVENTSGLTSLLAGKGKMELEQVVKETEIDNLQILTSGPNSSGLMEVLGSREMDGAIITMALNYEIVILDAPSVLAYPVDNLNLSNQCDGIVFVTRNGRTKVEESLKALDILDHTRAKFLGAVFNN